jgi:RNA:NAD 2'-phosphotransferase (TPT1/KptA family)
MMETKTMYHATDGSNAESIKENGLRADERGLVFVTTNKNDAERVGEIYPLIDDTVVFEVTVREHQIREDPDPHGDLDSRAVDTSGKIHPRYVEVAE